MEANVRSNTHSLVSQKERSLISHRRLLHLVSFPWIAEFLLFNVHDLVFRIAPITTRPAPSCAAGPPHSGQSLPEATMRSAFRMASVSESSFRSTLSGLSVPSADSYFSKHSWHWKVKTCTNPCLSQILEWLCRILRLMLPLSGFLQNIARALHVVKRGA